MIENKKELILTEWDLEMNIGTNDLGSGNGMLPGAHTTNMV